MMKVLVIGEGEMEGKMLYEKLMIACKEARGEIIIVDSVIDALQFDQSGTSGVMGEPGVLTYSRRRIEGFSISSGASGLQMRNKPDKVQRQAWRAMERKGKLR